jgi:hypothetical protein
LWYFLWHSTISTLFCLTILICLSLSSYVLVLPLKNGLRQIIIFGFAALSDDVIILEPKKWRLIQKFLEKSRTNKNFTFLKVKVNGFLQCHKTPYTSIKFLFIILAIIFWLYQARYWWSQSRFPITVEINFSTDVSSV